MQINAERAPTAAESLPVRIPPRTTSPSVTSLLVLLLVLALLGTLIFWR